MYELRDEVSSQASCKYLMFQSSFVNKLSAHCIRTNTVDSMVALKRKVYAQDCSQHDPVEKSLVSISVVPVPHER
jgi:hypothetical protein